MTRPFRHALTLCLTVALLIAGLGQGHVQAAHINSGEVVVLCGSDGSPRSVLFDGENYAPASPFHHCQDCCDGLIAGMLPLPPLWGSPAQSPRPTHCLAEALLWRASTEFAPYTARAPPLDL